MNIKSLITSFALVTAATTTAAMADGRAEAGVRADASFSIRDHRSPAPQPVYQPVVRDHRDHRTPARPVVYQPAPQIRDRDRDHRDRDRDEWNNQSRWTRPAEPKFIISYPTVNTYGGDYVGTYQCAAGEVISQPTRIGSQREDFTISDQGRFNTVELQGVVGSSTIEGLTVDFADGGAQHIAVRRVLDANQTIALDVQGTNRQIIKVFVYGATANGSAYQMILK